MLTDLQVAHSECLQKSVSFLKRMIAVPVKYRVGFEIGAVSIGFEKYRVTLGQLSLRVQ